MPRTIWKGAVSFGLVHIPVSLMPATVQRGIDFDWLDKRTLDPVGYKRINKATGEEIESENIVRGVEFEKDRYVVLGEEEIRAAYPESTQTVDIVAFVKAQDIPMLYLDTPYYLAPERRGGKAYALLRRALEETGRLALANVVMHTKQHLAVVVPLGDVLVLNTLRWGNEVRSVDEIDLGEDAVDPRFGARELDMARRLVEEMSEDWEPAQYREEFTEKIMALVERKAQQGKLETVGPVEKAPEEGAEIINLAELLKRSLGKRAQKANGQSEDEESRTTPPQHSRAAPKKRSSGRAARPETGTDTPAPRRRKAG